MAQTPVFAPLQETVRWQASRFWPVLRRPRWSGEQKQAIVEAAFGQVQWCETWRDRPT
jgi:hypothetical protein